MVPALLALMPVRQHPLFSGKAEAGKGVAGQGDDSRLDQLIDRGLSGLGRLGVRHARTMGHTSAVPGRRPGSTPHASRPLHHAQTTTPSDVRRTIVSRRCSPRVWRCAQHACGTTSV